MRDNLLRTFLSVLSLCIAASSTEIVAGNKIFSAQDYAAAHFSKNENNLIGESEAPNSPPPGNRLLTTAPNLGVNSNANMGDDDPQKHNIDSFTIVLDPYYRTLLSAEIISPVKHIFKRMGDTVTKGDLLIELDSHIFLASYKKALAAVSKSDAEVYSQRELFRDGLASFFELKDAESNLATALSDLASAKKALDSAYIISPYDGKVVALFVEEGELPSNNVSRNENREMIELIYDRMLMGKMLLPSTFINQIYLDETVAIHVRETGTRVLGKVRRIGPVIDPTSATVKIEVEIDNSEGKLVAGMTGQVYFSEENLDNETAPEQRSVSNQHDEQDLYSPPTTLKTPSWENNTHHTPSFDQNNNFSESYQEHPKTSEPSFKNENVREFADDNIHDSSKNNSIHNDNEKQSAREKEAAPPSPTYLNFFSDVEDKKNEAGYKNDSLNLPHSQENFEHEMTEIYCEPDENYNTADFDEIESFDFSIENYIPAENK